jgi:hypothetical protein
VCFKPREYVKVSGVSFYSDGHWADQHQSLDALHPHTLLTYGMNGRDSGPHRAPCASGSKRKMGYKKQKFVRRIVPTEAFDDGSGKGTSRTAGPSTLESERDIRG